MNNKNYISATQLMLMAVASGLMFPFTVMPLVETPPYNQDIWISLLGAVFYLIIIAMPSLILMNRFRGVTFNETNELILGKILGKLSAVLFVLLFIACFYLCMATEVMFIALVIMPKTPNWAILVCMLGPISYAVYKGAGVIGRLAVFIALYMIFNIIFFAIFGFHWVDFNNLRPVLADSTFAQINQGAFLTASRYSEVLIFFVFSYFLSQKASINKTFVKAIGIFAVCFLLMILCVLLVLGYDIAQANFNSYYTFTRQISISNFIEKIEAISLSAWFPGSLLKLTIYNFMACYVLSGIFKTKSHHGFVIPLSVSGLIFCLIPALTKTDFILKMTSNQVMLLMILPITFGVPLLLLIVYLWRRKKIGPILAQKKQERISQSAESSE